jgi:ferredoxin
MNGASSTPLSLRGAREREFIAINAELAKVWKPIIEKKNAPPDADDWAQVSAKRELLES